MSTTPMQQAQSTAYQQPIDAVLSTLDTDASHGLSAREARARLDRHGKNELTAEKPIPAWRKFPHSTELRGGAFQLFIESRQR